MDALSKLLEGSPIPSSEVVEYRPMMAQTLWHQGAPFDKETPIRRGLRLSSPLRQAPSGCAPIAVGQWLTAVAVAHHSSNPLFRAVERVSNVDPSVVSSREDKRLAGRLLLEIGEELGTLYTADFGLTWPWRIFLTFSRMRFASVQIHVRHLREATLASLRRGIPVIITGGREDLTFHTWLVDGFVRTSDRLYVHCNYGWGGTANGYYLFGHFDTSEGPLFREPQERRLPLRSTGRYYRLLNLITVTL